MLKVVCFWIIITKQLVLVEVVFLEIPQDRNNEWSASRKFQTTDWKQFSLKVMFSYGNFSYEKTRKTTINECISHACLAWREREKGEAVHFMCAKYYKGQVSMVVSSYIPTFHNCYVSKTDSFSCIT